MGLPGPSGRHLGRLGPIFRRLEAFLDHLVDHLGAVRASRKRVCRNGADCGRLPPSSAGLPPASAGVPRVAGAMSRGVPPRPPRGTHNGNPSSRSGKNWPNWSLLLRDGSRASTLRTTTSPTWPQPTVCSIDSRELVATGHSILRETKTSSSQCTGGPERTNERPPQQKQSGPS